MSRQLTAEDARVSLSEHAAARGADIREKYGPSAGWVELQRILADRSCVRYACDLVFDATALRAGEFAHPEPKGARPEDGFTLFVHPHFADPPDRVVPLVFYQLVAVNYGGFAGPDDAEAFGASALGISRDDYYRLLCAMADEITAG